MRKIILIAAVAGVSGCASSLPIAEIADVRATDGSPSIDIYQNRRVAGQDVPDFFGDQLVTVRTYEEIEDKVDPELAGATCDIRGAGFTAMVTTPAAVRVPLYRSKTGTLSATCSKDGYAKRSGALAPVDVERGQAMQTGAHFGLIGFAVGAIVDAASDHSDNEWRYPGELHVTLTPAPGSTTPTATSDKMRSGAKPETADSVDVDGVVETPIEDSNTEEPTPTAQSM